MGYSGSNKNSVRLFIITIILHSKLCIFTKSLCIIVPKLFLIERNLELTDC